MSRNRQNTPPPKAPEPKAADVSESPAGDLQAQIAAQMAAASGVASESAGNASAAPDDEPAGDAPETAAEPAQDTSEPPPSATTPAVEPPVPPKAPEPKAGRFKLGGLGELHHDGTVYRPGETLPFTAEQVQAFGLTHCAVPVEG